MSWVSDIIRPAFNAAENWKNDMIEGNEMILTKLLV